MAASATLRNARTLRRLIDLIQRMLAASKEPGLVPETIETALRADQAKMIDAQ